MATDLRTQFLNYMTLQRFSDHTKRCYVTGVKGLAKYYKKSPDTLSNEQIQDYLLYLLQDRKLTWGSVNAYLSGLVCFYKGFCKWDETQFRQYRPGKWLFTGQNPDKHLSEAAARNAFYLAKKKPVSTKAAAFMY